MNIGYIAVAEDKFYISIDELSGDGPAVVIVVAVFDPEGCSNAIEVEISIHSTGIPLMGNPNRLVGFLGEAAISIPCSSKDLRTLVISTLRRWILVDQNLCLNPSFGTVS